MTWLSTSAYLLSGYTLVVVASLVARAAGSRAAPSPLHKLAFSLVAAISLVCVSSFPLRIGLGSVGAFLQTLGPSLVLLGIIGGALLMNDLRGSRASLHVTPGGVIYASVLASLLVVISYLFVAQSVDTNYDFYYANYKAIGWALHDGNMANPLLQPLYDLRGFPAYWSYVALDGVLGVGSSLFSVTIAALLTLCLTVYAFAREFVGKEVGLAASLIVLASPLTFLYSYRGLDMDLFTYSAVLLAFYATLMALRRGQGSRVWGLLAGLSSGAALMTDPKGFIVLLLVPTAIVAAARSRAAKAIWSAAVYGALAYFVIEPIASAGQPALSSFALLTTLAIPVVLLYFAMSLAGREAAGKAGMDLRCYLAFGLGIAPGLLWTSFFGYLQLVLHPVHGIPSQLGLSYVLQQLGNAPNMLYSLAGLFSYPFLGVPFILLGLAVAAYSLSGRREGHLAQLFAFSIIVVLSVFAFAQGSIALDNWRYFYLLVPLDAIFIARGLARVGGIRRLLPLSAAFTAAFVFMLLPEALAFSGNSLWFANAVRGLEAWLDPALVPWVAGAIILGLGYLLTMSPERHAARLRESLFLAFRSRDFLVGMAAGTLAIVLAACVVAPFAPMIQRTAFADISEVKDTGPTWNAGLRAPFDYLAQGRASFGGSAFLTYAAYGIEYYAGVPSLDMNQSAQVEPLLPYINDTSALRQFLLDHGIRYALFPLQTNLESGIGPSAYALMSRTALGSLIAESAVIKTWDGWALYDLSQG